VGKLLWKKGGDKFAEIQNQNEANYLQEFISKKGDTAGEGLRSRYEAKETKAEYVLNQIQEFSKSHRAEYKHLPEKMKEMVFNSESKKVILEIVQGQIDALLLSKEKGKGRYQERKHESVSNEAKRYADLLEQAQIEGDINTNVLAEVVLQKLQENVAVLALQDEAAAENLMGDHGVRHLVDHNIKISEDILSQIQLRGGEVKAIDRILAHQIMIDHDLGYAMDPVRNSINEQGIKGQDAGHNLLAAKFIKERGENRDDKINQLFKQEHIDVMHAGILNHDSSEVKITLDNSAEARRANLESAIHIADNTHAFEDKLPELLYAVPDSLKTMRLLKVAGETGDDDLVEKLKADLVNKINDNKEYTDADKKALSMAAGGLTAENYKFSVPRICGNKPEIIINEGGKVVIIVQESAIHREATALFGGKELDQLKKFIKDLGGPKDIPEFSETIETEKIIFKTKRAEGSSPEKTDYQESIATLIQEPRFRAFAEQDDMLGKEQKAFQIAKEMGEVEKIKKTRKELVQKYLE